MLAWKLIKTYARRDEGQTMAEYGVVLGVIVLGVILAIGTLGLAITGNFDDVTAGISL